MTPAQARRRSSGRTLAPRELLSGRAIKQADRPLRRHRSCRADPRSQRVRRARVQVRPQRRSAGNAGHSVRAGLVNAAHRHRRLPRTNTTTSRLARFKRGVRPSPASRPWRDQARPPEPKPNAQALYQLPCPEHPRWLLHNRLLVSHLFDTRRLLRQRALGRDDCERLTRHGAARHTLTAHARRRRVGCLNEAMWVERFLRE